MAIYLFRSLNAIGPDSSKTISIATLEGEIPRISPTSEDNRGSVHETHLQLGPSFNWRRVRYSAEADQKFSQRLKAKDELLSNLIGSREGLGIDGKNVIYTWTTDAWLQYICH